jgi:hypothetical protein
MSSPTEETGGLPPPQAEEDLGAAAVTLEPADAPAPLVDLPEIPEAAAPLVEQIEEEKEVEAPPPEEAQAAAATAAAAAGNAPSETVDGDPFHIGNMVTIVSDMHGLTVGRIAYRDANLLRVIPVEASDRAIEFKLTGGDGMEFAPELGVREVELVERQASDYYVDFLGVRPGETVELFTVDGQEAAPAGVVKEVIKTASKDSLRLEDGRMLRFRGIGPEPPIAVVRVRTAANVAAAAGEGGAGGAEESAAAAAAAAATERQQDLMDLLFSALPPSRIEVVPTAERSYPDALQREDLFQNLLARISAKQRTNPRRIRYLEREVDLALALKNAVVERSESGTITGVKPQELNTFGDAVAASSAPIPMLIPIVAAARVLNLDKNTPGDGSYKPTDVLPRDLNEVELGALQAEQVYLAGSNSSDTFYAYMYNQLTADQVTLSATTTGAATAWREDQDVIRTAGLGAPVQGLSANLPARNLLEAKVSVAYLVSDVTDRTIRAVGPQQFYNHKTGETHTIAPSDPTALAGYVVLPPKAALKLRPPSRPGDLPTALLYSAALEANNLPTITATLEALYSPDASPLNAWTLETGAASTSSLATWLDTVLKYAVHPSEALGPRTAELLSVLDSLGIGGRDMSTEVARVVRKWVTRCQAQWRDLLKAQRDRIQKALNDEKDRVFQSVTGADSPLWPALIAAEPLKDLMEDVRRRNPAIAGASTTIATALLQEAQGDAAPLAWSTIAKIDNRPYPLDEKTAADALAASRSYGLRRKALRDIALLRMRAEPEINPCVHVKQLEAIRNLPDVLQRSRLLREFIEEYQGKRKGDWMTCTLCSQEAVCYHELMDLEALAQPARMEAIQKQMRIQYGGERYQGKIICKNCGQGLQEIDYDEHVEFDDEGRPITGGSVLTDEQMEDAEETSWKKATAALVAPAVEFATASQREIGDALQTLAERAGVLLREDVTRRIVRYADLYVSLRAPPQADYEKRRATMMVSAATKIRASTGAAVSAAAIDVPTYAALVDQLRVSALMALLAIELEIADPPLVVNNPFPLCRFARGGWPISPEAKPEDPGCLQYVACVVGSLQRDAAPWRHMLWAGDTKPETRSKKALSVAWSASQVIVGADPKLKALLPFTPEIRMAITKARTDEEAKVARALVSHTDQIPVGFRPEPFPVATTRPGMEVDPLPAAEAAIAGAGGTAEAGRMLGAVAAAVRQQAAAVVTELHTAAQQAIKALPLKPTNTTAFTCCATPLREVEAGALLGAPESRTLVAARDLLRGAVPTAVNAGTHLWQQFDPATAAVVEPTVEAGAFFKLFLKYCYTGPQVGEAHEFSVGNICRQCGLALGKPLDLVDFSKEGAGILAAQQGDLRVETTEAAFEALSEAVRRRRILTVPARSAVPTWVSGLQALVEATGRSASESVQAIGAALQGVLEGMADERTATEATADELARVTLWEPIASQYDLLREGVGERIGPLVPTAAGRVGEARAREAAAALAMLETLTEDPFLEGPRALQEYWCAKTQATGAAYAIASAPVLRWFKKATNSSHVDRINKFVLENSAWYGQEATLTAEARRVIGRIGQTLGPLLALWVDTVRSAGTPLWTVTEAQLLLRALVLSVWRDATFAASWMYADLTGAAERESTAAAVANWTRALMVHAKQQFVRYSEEKIRQVLQQRAELERTAVVNELLGQEDDDLRAAEYLKKTFRIGRWALGKNLRAYDADLLDAEVEQRRAQGVIETAIDPVLLESQLLAAAAAAAPEEGYDMNQGAAGDDY